MTRDKYLLSFPIKIENACYGSCKHYVTVRGKTVLMSAAEIRDYCLKSGIRAPPHFIKSTTGGCTVI